MSHQWLWRSAGECRGPLTAAELAELLRSRSLKPTDELQPVGATGWTSVAALADAVSAGVAAADAAAELLLAAEDLRRHRPAQAPK